MGLSRNKVAVSEGAAGSPPFYGESAQTNTMFVAKRESKVFWVRCSILKDLLKRRKQQKPKYCEAILHGEANSSRSEFMCEAQFICEATYGGVAQLGEHLPCKQGVMGSNPIISTNQLRNWSREERNRKDPLKTNA